MNLSREIFLQQEDISAQCIDEIVAIERDCHYNPWTKASFLSALQAHDILKKFILDDEAVGYFVAKLALDQCELLNLTVKKTMQSKGIGRIILNQLKEICLARNISHIFLEVRRSNVNAIKLYVSFGFNETGIRKNYYRTKSGKEDAVLMGLSL